MRVSGFFALAVSLFLFAGTAAAQQPGRPRDDPNCSDDRGVDRCSAEQHRRVLRLFRLDPIETHLAAGAQVRRVFYVEGYGHDILALTFIRAPGRDAVMQAHVPVPEGSEPRPPLEALVPESMWQEVIAASELFDRRLPAPPDDDGAITVCLHSWVFTVEATDPPDSNRSARLRRATEDACENGPAEVFATFLYRSALSLLPYCTLLDPRHYRNEASMIAACSYLSGDRAAAAGAMNGANALSRVENADDIALVRQAMGYGTELDWQGRRSERGEAAAAWLAGVTAVPFTNFYIVSVHGLTSERARVEGLIGRDVAPEDADASILEQARVEQIWVRESGRSWTIERATVGPFERVSGPQ